MTDRITKTIYGTLAHYPTATWPTVEEIDALASVSDETLRDMALYYTKAIKRSTSYTSRNIKSTRLYHVHDELARRAKA